MNKPGFFWAARRLSDKSPMHLLVIRTRLQALIARQIMATAHPGEKYIAVFIYQYNKSEDAPEVYALYNQIRTAATASFDVVTYKSFLGATVLLWGLCCFTTLTRGTIFGAVIDNYQFAMAARFAPFSRFCTFDDGAANFLPESNYFKQKPLEGQSLKRFIARFIFPEGSAAWFRRKSLHHYTIFHGLPNIVDESRLRKLTWDWTALLDVRDVEKLPKSIQKVILGTPHRENPAPQATRQFVRELLDSADLYIMHPREEPWIDHPKVVRLYSPAEAVLTYLTHRGALEVWHYDSTARYALHHADKVTFRCYKAACEMAPRMQQPMQIA